MRTMRTMKILLLSFSLIISLIFHDSAYARFPAQGGGYPSAGIPLSTGTAWGTSIPAASTSNTWLNYNGTSYVWGTPSGSGTVTSVGISGGTTGLTASGTPITGSGTITLAGTLVAANGGTGITSLGAGIPLFFGTPTSANLASAVTDETGSGSLVFSTSPTLTTPNLGTPSAINLTNATNLPATSLPAFSGDVTTSAGSSVTTLAASGVTAGTYNQITVNAKGIVTAGQTTTTFANGGTPYTSAPTLTAAMFPQYILMNVSSATSIQIPTDSSLSISGTANAYAFTVMNEGTAGVITFLAPSGGSLTGSAPTGNTVTVVRIGANTWSYF